MSAGIVSDIDHVNRDGTSMAAPHVVGVAAVVLGLYPSLASLGSLTADYVRNYIVLTEATVGVVTDAGAGSPNRFLYLNPFIPLDVLPLVDQTTKINASFSAQLSASGGYAPYSWTAIGLPSGVTINATTGLISGTPTVAGQFEVGYTVSDAQGQVSGKTFAWTVTEVETRTFTGSATSSKPTTALTQAASRAQSAATGAGFSHCEMTDSTLDQTEFGSYFATATLTCTR